MKLVPASARVFLFGFSLTARAVIFYATGDPTFNTTAPTGSLAGSGWQWVGSWDGYAGTPIGQNFFLTAQHVGGNLGDPFVFNGVSYTTTAFYNDTSSDLRICQVNGMFPSWAPLYRGSSEVGSPLVAFGYGLSRGDPVTVEGVLKGWLWAQNTSEVLRWGQNTFASVGNGGSYWGQLLYAVFSADGGANQADLDSSGPLFINDGTGWKLAGIAAAVDGPFNTTNTGSGFDAALFDARGLYVDESGTWDLVSGPSPVPSGFYATQVSVRASWIDSIVPASPGDTDAPLFSGPQTAVYVAGLLAVGIANLKPGRNRPFGPVGADAKVTIG
jgi:hypothetical protein